MMINKKMKRTSKRILLLTMLFCIVASLILAGCQSGSGGNKPGGGTSGTGTGDDPLSDNLPNVDLEGYDFRYFMLQDALTGTWTFDAEDDSADPVSSAIYNRNQKLEERFHFNFIAIGSNGYGTTFSMIETSILSGSDEAYDLFGIHNYECATSLLTSKYVYNMNQVEYLNFDKVWWHNQINSVLQVYDYLPFASSDFSLNSYQYAHALIFNRQMAKDIGFENEDKFGKDMYSLIFDGEWTFDLFAEVIRTFTNDFDGNGTMDENDSYGLASNFTYHLNTWTYAGNEMGIKVSNDGELTLNYTEKFFDIATKVYDMYFSSGNVFEILHDEECAIPWDSNRIFMQAVWLNDLENFRASTSEYGIIPFPKLTESQKDYQTYVDARGLLFCIPVNHPNVPTVGLVLEAMSAESYKTVIPAYYGIVLKNKYAKDEESIKMLDLIMAGRVWDFGYIYPEGGYSMALGNYLRGSGGKMSSVLKKIEGKNVTYYEGIIAAYKELSDEYKQ